MHSHSAQWMQACQVQQSERNCRCDPWMVNCGCLEQQVALASRILDWTLAGWKRCGCASEARSNWPDTVVGGSQVHSSRSTPRRVTQLAPSWESLRLHLPPTQGAHSSPSKGHMSGFWHFSGLGKLAYTEHYVCALFFCHYFISNKPCCIRTCLALLSPLLLLSYTVPGFPALTWSSLATHCSIYNRDLF